MSQHWHAHWLEETFTAKRLQNWEVPKWYPQWPTRHCTTTQFEAHKNGRLFASMKRSNPWGNFKGTWELPLKIDRATAEKLSKSTEYKKRFWNAHKKKHTAICEGLKAKSNEKGGKDKKEKVKELSDAKKDYLKRKQLKKIEVLPSKKCRIKNACIL